MFHRHYLFLKSDANRFRTGAGYFRIRVQRYEKILIYANFGARKKKKNGKMAHDTISGNERRWDVG